MAVKSIKDDANMTGVNPDATSDPTVTTATTSSTTIINAVTPSKRSKQQGEEVFSPELLKMYYARLFPYSLLCKWLSYDPSFDKINKSTDSKGNGINKKIFSRREFSFTLEPVPGEEIYIRYQSFSDLEGLKSAVNHKQPRKIDIGAVFSHPPKDKNAFGGSSSKSTGFRPVQRELVFDIDLTDYDDVRRCGCSGAKICRVCWTFMTAALKILDQGLREDFGFKHIAWFYSGRRGIHAWVCDEKARNLSNEARSAVANYFEISLNKKNNESLLGSKSNSSATVHPMLTRAYDILEPYFFRYVLPGKSDDISNHNDDDSSASSEMIGGHGLLASRDAWEDLVLDTLPTVAKESVGQNLKKKWANPREADDLTPIEKWNTLLQHLRVKFDFPNSWPSSLSLDDADQVENSKSRGNNKNKRFKSNKYSSSNVDIDSLKVYMWPMEIVFKYTYPRLDINVSKMQNHLLKSPFCVHPKTGRVCVPINPSALDIDGGFDPFAVPTLAQLADELDEYHKNDNDGNNNKNAQEDDGNENDENNTETRKKNIVAPQHDWEKTSLKKYFEVFEKVFLQPLEKEWCREKRDFVEEQAATRGGI